MYKLPLFINLLMHAFSVLYLSIFRDILELTEAIKIKETEALAYISEIEVCYLTGLFFPLILDELQSK